MEVTEKNKRRRNRAGQGQEETEAPGGAATDSACGKILLQPKGPLDISAAADFRLQLREALNSGSNVEVSLSHVSEMDVTAVQLLWAAHRSSAGRLRLSEGPCDEVRSVLMEVGLDQILMTLSETSSDGVQTCPQ